MNGVRFDHAGRLRRARAAMASTRVDALLLSVGTDLPYLLGYEAMASERLTMAVIPAEGDVTLFVPRLEAPRVQRIDDVFTVRSWGETDHPVDTVADLVRGATTVAIGDHTWSRFLLALQDALPDVRFQPASPLTAPLRLVKEPGETELLRGAGAAADRVARHLIGEPFSGRAEKDLARWIGDALVQEGHDSAAFTIVASGPNSASPHHQPGHRMIRHGDTVVLDFGGRIGGYCSDTSRTFSVGAPPGEVTEVYQVLREAQQAGVDAVRPGATAESVDGAARRVIEDAGYGEHFIHRTGHGIGLEVHEDPYLVDGNTQLLEPGMVFSVEPGIYLAGRFGVRIEDIVVVTDDGAERLNHSSRDLIVAM